MIFITFTLVKSDFLATLSKSLTFCSPEATDLHSSAVWVRFASFLPVKLTLAPCSTKCIAVALPMPELAPKYQQVIGK